MHVDIKIPLSRIHVQPIDSDGKHEGCFKSSCEIAGTFEVVSTEVEVDVFLVDGAEKSSGEDADEDTDQEDRDDAASDWFVGGLLVVAEGDGLTEQVEFLNDPKESLFELH